MTMVFLSCSVEDFEQLQDLVGAVAIEIARGLVCHENLGVVHDGARNRHPLLLPARQLPRVVPHALRQTDDPEGRLRTLFVARSRAPR